MTLQRNKALIIGGGLSGLTAGVYLLKNGFDVEILEKNHYLGGLCTGWVRKGSYIDGCIHWLTESNHGELYNVMREIGVLTDDVPVYHLEAYCQTKVNGKEVNFYRDADRLEQELLSFATPNDVPKIRRLVTSIRRCHRNLITAGKPYHLWRFLDRMKFIFRILPLISELKWGSKVSLADFADSLESPELKYVFSHSFIPSYYSMFSFANTMGGICDSNSGIPAGGSKEFAYRLVGKFKALGGTIRTGCPASRVVVEGEKATGVLLQSGEFLPADYVVPACDVHYTQDVLFNRQFPIEQLVQASKEKKDYPSYSLFQISFRTSTDLSALNVNRYIKTEDYEVLGEKINCMYLKHFGYDESLKHDGMTVVQAIIGSSEKMYDSLKAMSKDDYKAFKVQLADKVRDVIAQNVEGYGELELLDVCTPLTFSLWVNAYKGTFMAHALSKRNRQLILRNDILPLRNVALAGHWMMMPGGVPIAILQGKFAADTIVHMRKFPHYFNLQQALKRLRQPLKKVGEHSFFKRES